MRTITRRALAAGCSAAMLMALPALASAEIRQGTLTDPAADSAGAPSQDIVSASAQYDTNGQMTVSATMNGDVAGGPQSFLSFMVQSYAAPNLCTGSYVSIFGSSDSTENLVMVSGVSGVGSGIVTHNGAAISFRASGSALRDRDYSCMTLTVSSPDGSQPLDQLSVPLFFDGYGPATTTPGTSTLGTDTPGASMPGTSTPGTSTPAAKKNARR